MEGLKHTKGPWSYTILGPHRNNKEVLAIEINYGKDGECIADTVYEEADARLIAAAPEMLEALVHQYKWVKGLYDLYEIDETKYPKSDLIVTERDLRRLIECATGMKIKEVLASTARQDAEQ